MRTLLELIRIIVLFVIVCSVFGYVFGYFYLEMGINIEKYGFVRFIAIFILFFVLYRNKLQFSGWYTGKGREKLPKLVSQILILSSIGILLLPPVLTYIIK